MAKSKAAEEFLRRIGNLPAIPGQPSSANIPGVGPVYVGGSQEIQDAARAYAQSRGLDYREVEQYAKLNPDFSAEVAREYDMMKHAPQDPEVASAYKKLSDETMDQYEAMLSAGVKPYFITGKDPYSSSPYMSLLDLAENKRLGVFPTRSGFGSSSEFDPANNPLLAETGLTLDGQPLLVNDAFRAVHDYFGHAKGGFGFRGAGEENAYRAHSGMYSPEAARAAASETRGQNSWLNFGPYGEANRTATIGDTIFADQKTGLLPNWAALQGTPLAAERRDDFFRYIGGAGQESLGGLRAAISPEGNLRLVHYTGQPIERIDPAFYGSGLSGRTIAERNRALDPDFAQRSYYGIESADNPYIPERGLRTSSKLQTEIPVEQVYDMARDPDNLTAKIPKDVYGADRATFLENLIKKAGYSGYFSRSKAGDIAAIFDPLNVGKTHKFALTGAGLAGLYAAGSPKKAMASEGGTDFAAEAGYRRDLADYLAGQRFLNPDRGGDVGSISGPEPDLNKAAFYENANTLMGQVGQTYKNMGVPAGLVDFFTPDYSSRVEQALGNDSLWNKVQNVLSGIDPTEAAPYYGGLLGEYIRSKR